ncbi:MAG: toll/interleukin-1 receptor domain-containing protein [Elusimicrobia bacterium]|nr:toll/interleukin-1 receptor domain-containing protein [Elusimicrobiota bacterium]
MSIYISYPKENADFANHLASELVRRNHCVWVEKWELQAGDSLIEKVQGTITDSDALLVVISKASVAAAWCRRSLAATLTREVAAKHAIIVPVLMEDCEIPLFVTNYLRADFRKGFDAGFKNIFEGIAAGARRDIGEDEPGDDS